MKRDIGGNRQEKFFQKYEPKFSGLLSLIAFLTIFSSLLEVYNINLSKQNNKVFIIKSGNILQHRPAFKLILQ